MTDLPDIRAGVWRHYKGPLYNVLGYSHNASDGNNPQVLYIGLELDSAKTGPRFATRDVEEWSELVCTMHDGMSWHSEEHEKITAVGRRTGYLNERQHQEDACVPRFTYLGPVYYAGMERSHG